MSETIIFLMNGWDSAAGGIQTVNRELAVAFANQNPNSRCVALVENASETEHKDAFARGVNLISGAPGSSFDDLFNHHELDRIDPDHVVAIIGHSRFSGPAAAALKSARFGAAQLVHFVHTSPLHLEANKEGKSSDYVRERENKVAEELELALGADLVVCIGPRLHRSMGDLIRASAPPTLRIEKINCGISRDPTPRPRPPEKPTILSLGRTESMGVKGLDILAYSAGYLQKMWQDHPVTRTAPAPQFVIRGVENDAEEFEKKLTELACEVGPRPEIYVRPYTTDRKTLIADYRGASVFLMPSREEGFGLVACEALSQGTPVIVTEQSGFAEVLQQASSANLRNYDRCVISAAGDPKEVARKYADAVLSVLTGTELTQAMFDLMADDMSEISSWDSGAKELAALIRSGREPKNEKDPVLGGTAPSIPRSAAEGHSVGFLEHIRAQDGVLDIGIEEVVVVSIRQGATHPKLPPKVGNLEVVVREVTPIKLMADPSKTNGNLKIEGSRRATVSYFTHRNATFALTAHHAIDGANEAAITFEHDGREYDAFVSTSGRTLDWALLHVPKAPRPSETLSIGVPEIGASVSLIFDGEHYAGSIKAADVTGIAELRRLSDRFNHLILVDSEKPLPPGVSGAIYKSDETGEAIGMVVAMGHGENNQNSIYCVPIALIMEEMAHVESELSSPARSIGVLTFDLDTLTTVLDRLRNVNRTTVDGFTLFSGRSRVTQDTIQICHSDRPGNIEAALAAQTLVQQFNPDLVLILGVAGGLDRAELTLGDVVIGTQVVYYEYGTLDGGAAKSRLSVSGQQNSEVRAVSNLAGQTLRAKKDRVYQVKLGLIASGEKTVRSASDLQALLGNLNALAVDMESAGAFRAIQRSNPTIPIFSVRGVSDFADQAKEDSQREQAIANAVDTAFDLVSALSEALLARRFTRTKEA